MIVKELLKYFLGFFFVIFIILKVGREWYERIILERNDIGWLLCCLFEWYIVGIWLKDFNYVLLVVGGYNVFWFVYDVMEWVGIRLFMGERVYVLLFNVNDVN